MAAVTVVTTTFNRATVLPRALESVRRQTWSDWEHVVVDDGSTDETASVLQRYRQRDSRLRVVWQTTAGPAAAMNHGIRLATSPLVAFLDSDDEYTPDHLRRRLRYLEDNPEIDLLWGGLRVMGPRRLHFVPDASGTGRRVHLARCRVCGTFLVRKSLLRRLRGFRRLISADYDLCRRAEQHGARLVRIDWPTLLHHVDRPDRMTLRYRNVDERGRLEPEAAALQAAISSPLRGGGR